tara:strand:+ start:24 stop:224 length:201 start_codon:yes stop_codon:yes gene_type:complete
LENFLKKKSQNPNPKIPKFVYCFIIVNISLVPGSDQMNRSTTGNRQQGVHEETFENRLIENRPHGK